MTDRATVTVGPWPDRRSDRADDAGGFQALTGELRRQREENARLRAALDVRPCVSLATGVLMFRYGIEEKRALALLSHWSAQVYMELGAFAATVLEIAARDPESLEVHLFGVSLGGSQRAVREPLTKWPDV